MKASIFVASLLVYAANLFLSIFYAAKALLRFRKHGNHLENDMNLHMIACNTIIVLFTVSNGGLVVFENFFDNAFGISTIKIGVVAFQ